MRIMVFETVVKYLAENQKAGRQQVPVSINASSLHAMDPQTITIYMDILKKYDLDPALVEIELTETAVVSEYESVRNYLRNSSCMVLRQRWMTLEVDILF